MDIEQVTCPVFTEHVQSVIQRAHAAISRANALTSEVQILQRAANIQHAQSRAALSLALQLDEVALSRAAYDEVGIRPTGQGPADRAEAILRRAAATTQAAVRQTDADSASNPARQVRYAERPASGNSQQDVLADMHAATAAASSGHVRPEHALEGGWAVIRQQYTDNVTTTASLRRRQLRLRASQMRALRCLLTAEPQLAGYSATDSMVQQAISLLNTALLHVELAERVLSGWEATEALPLIITRADARAEAAAAVARDLLHSLHIGRQQDGSHGPLLQPQRKVLGATVAQIERLQHLILDATTVELLADSCSICLCGFALGDQLCSMQCGHVHHKDCLGEWLLIKAACPLCNNEYISTADPV